KIPEKFWDKIEEADITVHAGDYAREETFNALDTYSNEFYGVKGNCDFFESEELEQSYTFEVKGLNIGVYHGTGITPRGHSPTLEKIAAEDLEVEILINGHTHQQDIEKTDKVLLLNPGSCTGVGGGSARPSNPSMMMLEVEKEKLEVKILEMENDEAIMAESESFDIEEIKKE
ncbi:MAG: metallophosphoesterase, partial [Candidatus Nanohaloarchaea archaeon]